MTLLNKNPKELVHFGAIFSGISVLFYNILHQVEIQDNICHLTLKLIYTHSTTTYTYTLVLLGSCAVTALIPAQPFPIPSLNSSKDQRDVSCPKSLCCLNSGLARTFCSLSLKATQTYFGWNFQDANMVLFSL